MSTEGSVFQRKDKKWCAKYKDTSGKWKYLYRRTKGEAKAALREALKDREERINPTDLTVNNTLEAWLDETRFTVSYRTWVNRNGLYRCHIKNHTIGSMKLVKVTPDDVSGFYKDKAKTLAPSTIKFLHHILNKAFRDAFKRKQLRTNPVSEAPTPKVPRRDIEVLTVAQVRKLLETCKGDRYEGVYVLGACCGLRVGECLSLRWEDVDLGKGTIHVRRTLWQGRVFQPKTPHSRRIITLPTIALEALKQLNSNEEGYIFATGKGTPIAAPNFWRWHWRPMLKEACLPESLTFHQLRHGAASLMLNQNVPVPVVSRYLGHSNPYMTMKIYAHMIDGMGGLAASGIDDALS